MKIIKIIIISLFILTFIFLQFANIRTSYSTIKDDYKKYTDDLKYVTELFEEQNSAIGYIFITYDHNGDIKVNYEEDNEYKSTTFDLFFDDVLTADKNRIKNLLNKCDLKQILYKYGGKNDSEYEYTQFIWWVNMKYARGVLHSKKMYEPIGSEIIDIIPLDNNFYLFEEK